MAEKPHYDNDQEGTMRKTNHVKLQLESLYHCRSTASLEALLLEGLDSGEPIEVNAAWWKRKKDELLESHRAKGNGRRKK